MSLFSRSSIKESLYSTVSSGVPIIATGCSAGIIAKCAEKGGADLLIVYSTGKSRLMGLPTTRLGDSNKLTLGMADEILNVTKTPVIGGIEATDPTNLNLEKLLQKFLDAGYSGIINFPTVGIWPDQRKRGKKVGLGFQREIELIQLANSRDIFSMAYVASRNDAEKMVEAGVDCLIAHLGPTKGGLVGYHYDHDFHNALNDLNEIFGAASEKSNVFCLAHGGPISTPADTARVYEETAAVGFVAASSIERIPVEKAVIHTTGIFKSIPLKSPISKPSRYGKGIGTEVYHFRLWVSNMTRSLAFYVDLLGGTLLSYGQGTLKDTIRSQTLNPEDVFDIASIDLSSTKIELIQDEGSRKDADFRGGFQLVLKVEDVWSTHSFLKKNGLPTLSQPQEIGTGPNKGSLSFCALDPDGMAVEFLQKS